MEIKSISNIYFTNNTKYNSYKDNKLMNSKTRFHSYPTASYYPIFKGNSLNKNYDEWFKAYLKYSNEKTSIANEINKTFNNNEYFEYLNNKKNIKILDIGCGNGLLTEKVLNNMISILPNKKIKIDALDVNDKLLEEFDSRLGKFKNNVIVDSKKQNFFGTKSQDSKYDLILASHVLYYADNLDNAILNIYNHLDKKGKAIIVHHSGQDCLLSELRAKYNPASSANLNQNKEEITKKDIIKESLKKQTIPYESFRQYFDLKIPNTKSSSDFKNLISFIIDKPFNSILKENKINNIMQDIKINSDDENKIKLFNNMYVITKTNK